MPAEDYPTSKQRHTRPTPTESTDKRIVSTRLFGDTDLILIQHHEAVYRLRITRNDKLILTK